MGVWTGFLEELIFKLRVGETKEDSGDRQVIRATGSEDSRAVARVPQDRTLLYMWMVFPKFCKAVAL